MRFSAPSRVWRAILVAFGLAWPGPMSGLRAEPLVASIPKALTRSAEPFGLSATQIVAGSLYDRWRGLQRGLDDDMVQLALCDGDRDRCVSPAALRLLAVVDAARQREGRARLGELNRAINLAIRPMRDEVQYGEIDVWASPLATFSRGAGDCEDYAIAKLAALRLAGVAPDDLRILIVRDIARREDHALAAARLDGHWLTLDNRRMAMIEDADIRNYRPAFAMDSHGIRRYLPAPLLAGIANEAVGAGESTFPALIGPPAN